VAHSYNPSYSGGRDQEDHHSKPTRANSSQDPISKKTFTRKGLVKCLKVKVLSSNPKKETKKQTKKLFSFLDVGEYGCLVHDRILISVHLVNK
jgi:hypothetical protein